MKDLVQKLVAKIVEINKLQGNFLDKSIETLTENEYEDLKSYLLYCLRNKIELEFIAKSYDLIVKDTLKEQFYFKKHKKYRYSSFDEVASFVYHNDEYMKKYMIGLAITTFLWPNHLSIKRFFNGTLSEMTNSGKYLEIGPGHGLYLSEAIKSQNFKNFTVVDVSETSLNMCKRIIDFQNINNNVNYKLMDIYDYQTKKSYDFISMGEVLEHIETPAEIMKKLYELLDEDGMIFITTCANAPAIDHIYLFNNVDEIRDLFKSCNFKIKDELALPYVDRTLEETIQKKLTLNYCALISKT